MNYLQMTLVLALAFAVVPVATAEPHAASPEQRWIAIRQLPENHYRVVSAGVPYYFWGGHFYRLSRGRYVTTTPPVGVIVPTLPAGFLTIGAGDRRVFYYGGVHYRRTSRGFVVIAEPDAVGLGSPAA